MCVHLCMYVCVCARVCVVLYNVTCVLSSRYTIPTITKPVSETRSLHKNHLS